MGQQSRYKREGEWNGSVPSEAQRGPIPQHLSQHFSLSQWVISFLLPSEMKPQDNLPPPRAPSTAFLFAYFTGRITIDRENEAKATSLPPMSQPYLWQKRKENMEEWESERDASSQPPPHD